MNEGSYSHRSKPARAAFMLSVLGGCVFFVSRLGSTDTDSGDQPAIAPVVAEEETGPPETDLLVVDKNTGRTLCYCPAIEKGRCFASGSKDYCVIKEGDEPMFLMVPQDDAQQ